MVSATECGKQMAQAIGTCANLMYNEQTAERFFKSLLEELREHSAKFGVTYLIIERGNDG